MVGKPKYSVFRWRCSLILEAAVIALVVLFVSTGCNNKSAAAKPAVSTSTTSQQLTTAPTTATLTAPQLITTVPSVEPTAPPTTRRTVPATTPTTHAAPAPTTTRPPTSTVSPPASCHPLTNGGKCYEPGETCRDTDHGATGVAGDGKAITCEDNDGWRWEPT